MTSETVPVRVSAPGPDRGPAAGHAPAPDPLAVSAAPPDGGTAAGRTLPPRAVPAVALLLVAVHVGFTAARVSGAWWFQDDLNIFGLVADEPLTAGLLLQDYNGHLVPATWLTGWLITDLAPFAWWPAAVLQTVLVAATDLAMLLLLVRAFGARPAILLPFAAFCASSLTLTSTLWWAAAMQWLPAMLALALALWLHLGLAATGRRRHAVGAVLSVASGLLFFEKVLTVLPVLLLVSVLYLVPGPFWRRPFTVLRRWPGYWAAHGLLAAGYLALYLIRTAPATSPSKDLGDALEQARITVLETVVPGLLGGPVTWFTMQGNSLASWPQTPTALLYLSWVVAAALVLGSLAVRPGAWRAWLLLALYLAGTVAIVAWSRGGPIGPDIGRDLRYVTDVAVLAPFCAALAWLPLRVGGTAAAGAAAPAAGSGAARRATAADAWAAGRRRDLLLTGALAVALVTAGGVVSGNRFAEPWRDNPGPGYLAALRTDLDSADRPVVIFDQRVPEVLVAGTFATGSLLSHVTRPLERRPVIVDWAPEVQVVNPDGQVRPGVVTGSTSELTRPACTRRDGAPLRVPLPQDLFAWPWVVQVRYTAKASGPAVLQFGDGRRDVRLEQGDHGVVAQLTGAGSELVVDAEPGSRVCVSQVVVGQIRSATG